MTLLATLPALSPEQIDIFGAPAVLIAPWTAPEPAPPSGPAIPGLDQLNLVASQEPLPEAPAVAQQLPLLDDPPFWEEPPEPVAIARPRRARGARRRTAPALSPGQMSLF